jgi:hypothetical protein
MRLLSGCSRYLCVAVILLLVSCAAAPPHETEPNTHVLDGEVVIAGTATIDRRIQLASGDGTAWLLECPPLAGELWNLDGHRIRVWGTAKRRGSGPAILLVDRYEMLPVDGMSPIIGVVIADGEQVIFTARKTGDRFDLVGSLSEALKHFSGCTVWVWGVIAGDDAAGDGGAILEVRGYGILGPADVPTGSVPSDTLRNSGNR